MCSNSYRAYQEIGHGDLNLFDSGKYSLAFNFFTNYPQKMQPQEKPCLPQSCLYHLPQS